MNNQLENTINEKSSHCMNCGIAVRHGIKLDDKRGNKEFCDFCGNLAGKLIEAHVREELASEELGRVVAENLPSGVIINQSVMTKKEQIESKRERDVVLGSLRARREEMRSKILTQSMNN